MAGDVIWPLAPVQAGAAENPLPGCGCKHHAEFSQEAPSRHGERTAFVTENDELFARECIVPLFERIDENAKAKRPRGYIRRTASSVGVTAHGPGRRECEAGHSQSGQKRPRITLVPMSALRLCEPCDSAQNSFAIGNRARLFRYASMAPASPAIRRKAAASIRQACR